VSGRYCEFLTCLSVPLFLLLSSQNVRDTLNYVECRARIQEVRLVFADNHEWNRLRHLIGLFPLHCCHAVMLLLLLPLALPWSRFISLINVRLLINWKWYLKRRAKMIYLGITAVRMKYACAIWETLSHWHRIYTQTNTHTHTTFQSIIILLAPVYDVCISVLPLSTLALLAPSGGCDVLFKYVLISLVYALEDHKLHELIWLVLKINTEQHAKWIWRRFKLQQFLLLVIVTK
jgi:hypothetical protein